MELKDAIFRFEIAKELINKLDCDLSGKKFLDVGCGTGNMLLAASSKNAAECIGVDINLNDFGENHFEEIASNFQINIRNCRMTECRFEKNQFATGNFDVITLIDSIEHMDNPELVIAEISRVLKPGGSFLLNVSPLYYSPVGHHLFNHFKREEFPWVHLYNDFDDLLEKNKVEKWSLDHYYGLNKITSRKIIEYSEKYNLEIAQFETIDTGRDVFPKIKDRIDTDLLPTLFDDLFIESNTIIFKKRRQLPILIKISLTFNKVINFIKKKTSSSP